MRRLYALALFVFLLGPSGAFAATLSLSPSTGTYHAGDRVIVNVLVSSSEAMNAASGVVLFPTDLMSVEYVNKGSVLNFWVTEPSYSNATGKVNFEGVSLSGFQGSNGSVLTIAFRAKKTGSADIKFSTGQVLANDGQGTDITQGLNNATFTISGAAATPTSAPAPEETPAPEPVPTPLPQKPTLTTPVISLGAQRAAPSIVGQSGYPNADVLVTFVTAEGNKIFISGTTDSAGTFSVPVPRALRAGSYQVTALIVMPDGAHTEPSAPLTVPIGGLVSLDVTWAEIIYLIIFVGLLIGGIGYVFMRIMHDRREARRIRRETAEAASAVRKSFALLRKDVRTGSGTRRTDLVEDLEQAQNYIEKEIRDITEPDEKE